MTTVSKSKQQTVAVEAAGRKVTKSTSIAAVLIVVLLLIDFLIFDMVSVGSVVGTGSDLQAQTDKKCSKPFIQ